MSTLLVGPTDLRKSHEAFLGFEPTKLQLALYNEFPARRGAFGSELDEEVFVATVIMALVQTFSMKTQPQPFRAYLFVPPIHNVWAVEHLKAFAEQVFKRLKGRRATSQAQAMGRAFHSVLIGCRVLQFHDAPDRWAAFGFAASDPIPDWMKGNLWTAS